MNKKVKKKIMTLALAAMLTAVSVMPAKAASEDVIDTSKTASLTIHKYDITAATQAGVNVDDQISTGKGKTVKITAVAKDGSKKQMTMKVKIK